MPRIRTIKPELWDSPDVMAMDDAGQALFVWLISQADDYGRLHGEVPYIAHRRLRTASAVEKRLQLMAERGMIVRYEHQGKPYIALANWEAHQYVQHPAKPRLPAPPGPPDGPAPAAPPESSGILRNPPESSRRSARARADRTVPDRSSDRSDDRNGSSKRTVETPSPARAGAGGRPQVRSEDLDGDGAQLPPPSPEAVELLRAYEALAGHQPSATDRIKAGEFVAELPRLTVPEMAGRMRGHAEWCDAHRRPRPGSLGGYWDTLRREHDLRADTAGPATRQAGGLTRIGATA